MPRNDAYEAADRLARGFVEGMNVIGSDLFRALRGDANGSNTPIGVGLSDIASAIEQLAEAVSEGRSADPD